MGHRERSFYWVACDWRDCNASVEDDADSRYEAEVKARQHGFRLLEGYLWFCENM